MKANKRWKKAQEYERNYWNCAANRIASGAIGQLDWYAWRAKELEKKLKSYSTIDRNNNAKVLEIGTGPIGIISYLEWGERYAIDPLENYYRSNSVLSKLRDGSVCYMQGSGEELPFEDDRFSLIILDNVLDHVQDAKATLQESYRNLEKNGILYLTVNIRTSWGARIHSILSKLYIDKGHPYSFTFRKIHNFLHKIGFEIRYEEVEDYHENKRRSRRSNKIKERIKSYSGLSEFVYTAFCSK